jgi:hypothetical protein
MLNTSKGTPVAMIENGRNDGRIICLDIDDKDGYDSIDMIEKSILRPLMNYLIERNVIYIAGPAGSGKSTLAINLICDYLKIFPDCEFYLFSRTDGKNDPAFEGVKINQVKIDESLLENPIDIEKELGERSILFFDDCGTIQNDKLKNYIQKLMMDAMEIGRRLKINIIITNHLVNPSSKEFCRTVMNEMQIFGFFPKSGSSYQISYCLKNYFGLSKKQIDHILTLPSRWIIVSKQYPMYVTYEKGIYIL